MEGESTITKRPLLQVALDMTNLDSALRIALRSSRAGVDIIEVGTPLIKSEGVRSIKIIKTALPEKPIVADMKIVDAGSLETELAISAGADIVTVMALSDISTIKYTVETAKSLGGRVMIDMMNVPNPLSRTREILDVCKPDILCIHRGIDVQRKYRSIDSMVMEVRRLKNTFDIKIAVAGGIDESTAPILARAGADILIVGRAITTSTDIEGKVRSILTSMSRLG